METNLWTVRIKSFFWSLAGLAVTGIAGFLLSPDVQNLIQENFGETFFGSLIIIGVTEAAKHLRNIKISKGLGSVNEKIYI